MKIKEMEGQRKIFRLIRKLDCCSGTVLRLGSCSRSAGVNREGKTNREIKPVPQGYHIQKRINEVSTKSRGLKIKGKGCMKE
jgi:hypothetical protein